MNTKLANLVVKMVEAQKRANSFQSLTMKQVYGNLNAAKAMTIGEYHDLMRAMHKARMIHLGPYTQALATIPCNVTPMFLDGDVKFYVRAAQ